ncbi:MAG: plasmid mobilization relaxosome protein MobC [Alphaproteobacteria bacterium]|nr:plasmid mobilization relaxosome protein MobC [Alphaproteobacteria bacterium]
MQRTDDISAAESRAQNTDTPVATPSGAATGKYAILGQPNTVKDKSSAQVESFGSQKTGSQDSGELKLDGSRPYRIVVRFTKEEKDAIGSRAEKARMPVANYVRLSLLQQPGLDPERNKLLHKANYELTRQGTNLNQIAKHLNGGTATITEGNFMLAIIARSLLSAHKTVQHALSDGKAMP